MLADGLAQGLHTHVQLARFNVCTYISNCITLVLHRCNFDPQQRMHWVRLAQEGSHLGPVYTIAFHLQTPAAECKRRAAGRTDHPTLNGDTVSEVIDR